MEERLGMKSEDNDEEFDADQIIDMDSDKKEHDEL